MGYHLRSPRRWTFQNLLEEVRLRLRRQMRSRLYRQIGQELAQTCL